LLVDDEEDIALLFKEGIEIYSDFTVDVYTDPLTALHNFQIDVYDLVLVDIVMPKMNGLELYRLLREMDKKCKVCFFSASETNEEDLRDKFPELKGINSVLIQKPIKLKEFSKRILEIIAENK
jgi:DNA-binding response OmpR family regulator